MLSFSPNFFSPSASASGKDLYFALPHFTQMVKILPELYDEDLFVSTGLQLVTYKTIIVVGRSLG